MHGRAQPNVWHHLGDLRAEARLEGRGHHGNAVGHRWVRGWVGDMEVRWGGGGAAAFWGCCSDSFCQYVDGELSYAEGLVRRLNKCNSEAGLKKVAWRL